VDENVAVTVVTEDAANQLPKEMENATDVSSPPEANKEPQAAECEGDMATTSIKTGKSKSKLGKNPNKAKGKTTFKTSIEADDVEKVVVPDPNIEQSAAAVNIDKSNECPAVTVAVETTSSEAECHEDESQIVSAKDDEEEVHVVDIASLDVEPTASASTYSNQMPVPSTNMVVKTDDDQGKWNHTSDKESLVSIMRVASFT
jgi:hypothetical protein